MTLEVEASQFEQLISDLSPAGDLWSTEPDTVRMQWLEAFALTFQRLNERANFLVFDAFPSTTEELLPEWEYSLGLPDPCAGPDPTIAERQAHVVARLTQSNGPSIPSLTAFAAALGYTITITEFAPARSGLLRAGQPLYGTAWAFAWQVNAPAITITYFQAGENRAGDALETYGNLVLVCELKRIAPAHTIPIFSFGG